MNRPNSTGVVYALLAYGAWGLLPVYWKQLQGISAIEILCHRIIWSLVFLGGLVVWRRQWGEVRSLLAQPKLVATLLVSAIILSFNWGMFIYAINSNQVVQSGLGYYINPLVNVLIGCVFLREPLTRWQGLAVALAALGVANFVVSLGIVPWISLALAFSFASYALLRKLTPVPPLLGLVVEAALITPIALGILLYFAQSQPPALGSSVPITLWLMGAGAVTAIPLLWFNRAAKQLPFSTLGFLQYIGPSLQLGLGVLVYGEPFTAAHGVTFGLIWLGLAIYSYSTYRP
ncbi:transporter [Prochlorothrix hollandica PCC 9006 = CALU 1027]|uniref:Transporter n=2 Tax=Prochlorothrix hollandica TaxID=1223 RepID=A0A0M2Q0U1_PROHO|nr:transporter [Prochlorothrix hollandica PCC 9006 = CALU 1027]